MKKTQLLIFAGLMTLTLEQCQEGDPLCTRCGGHFCLNCRQSYPNQDGKCVHSSLKTIENCVSYLDKNTCRECRLGFSVSKVGNCVAVSKNKCLRENLNGECVICEPEYRVENGNCYTGGCGVRDCLLCQDIFGSSSCVYCTPGLTLYTFTNKDEVTEQHCIFEGGRITNCLRTVHGNKHECLECLPGFYFKQGECVKMEADVQDVPFAVEKFSHILGLAVSILVAFV